MTHMTENEQVWQKIDVFALRFKRYSKEELQHNDLQLKALLEQSVLIYVNRCLPIYFS